MSQVDYDELRKRARKRVEARREFRQHLGAYIIVHLFLWGIWFATGADSPPWPIFPMFGWGIGIFFHALDVYQKSSLAEVRREFEIEREIQRELEYRGLSDEALYNKPKRTVRLSDDGELVEIDDSAEESSNSKAKSR